MASQSRSLFDYIVWQLYEAVIQSAKSVGVDVPNDAGALLWVGRHDGDQSVVQLIAPDYSEWPNYFPKPAASDLEHQEFLNQLRQFSSSETPFSALAEVGHLINMAARRDGQPRPILNAQSAEILWPEEVSRSARPKWREGGGDDWHTCRNATDPETVLRLGFRAQRHEFWLTDPELIISWQFYPAREGAPIPTAKEKLVSGEVRAYEMRAARTALDYIHPLQFDAALTVGGLNSSADVSLRHHIVGKSEALQRALKELDTFAALDGTVYLRGESGTGKELFARALHRGSNRRDGPFIARNIATVPDTLAESELFGHRRGAFDGADRDRAGWFELAHGGTLLLDEIAAASPAVQAKLLRAIGEREVQRLGENRVREVDVRLVVATKSDLRQEVDRGNFRDDLYHRVAVLSIDLPPLRDRTDDIEELVAHFLRRTQSELGTTCESVSKHAIDALKRHSWDGNVRELWNKIQRAVAVAASEGVQRVELGHFEAAIRDLGSRAAGVGNPTNQMQGKSPTPKVILSSPEAASQFLAPIMDMVDAGAEIETAAQAAYPSESVRNVLRKKAQVRDKFPQLAEGEFALLYQKRDDGSGSATAP